jgi:pimeloyl-ACP methyl ester carboxylesterase
MPLIIFSHANSFGASTYRVLFRSLRSRGFTVKAMDKFGHDPRLPGHQQLAAHGAAAGDFARQKSRKPVQPAFLVGHSLGGFLSVMAAARHAELGGPGAKGVLLVDSPILGGWRATALGVVKTTQLVGSLSPGAVSRRRRTHWASAGEALELFRHKKAFARWDPQVLQDYITTARMSRMASAC